MRHTEVNKILDRIKDYTNNGIEKDGNQAWDIPLSYRLSRHEERFGYMYFKIIIVYNSSPKKGKTKKDTAKIKIKYNILHPHPITTITINTVDDIDKIMNILIENDREIPFTKIK
jgi:hypothetical protein